MYSTNRINRMLQFPGFRVRFVCLPLTQGEIFHGFTKVLLFKGDNTEPVAIRVVMDNEANKFVDRLLIRYYEVYGKRPPASTVDTYA